jgi:hypothetical protein
LVSRNLEIVLWVVVGSLILARGFLEGVFDDGEQDCEQCSYLLTRADILHLHEGDSWVRLTLSILLFQGTY